VLEEVKHIVRMGASVIRLHERSKRPVGDDWSSKPRLTFKQLQAQYRDDENLGVRLGKWSEIDGLYLLAIDVDIRDESRTDEALDTLEGLLPGIDVWKLPCVRSGSGGESRHFYFVTDKPFPSRKLAKSKDNVFGADKKWHKAWEIELFGTGKQVALPPSIHPITVWRYRWEVEVDVVDGFPQIDADLIEELVNPHGDEDYEPVEPIDVSYDEVREWLEGIDFDKWGDNRDGWIRLGMALSYNFHHSPEALEVWDEFSRRSPKYDEDDLLRNWESFKHKTNRPVTLRSIIKDYNEAKRDTEFRALPGEFDDYEPEVTAKADDFDDIVERPTAPSMPKYSISNEIGVHQKLLEVPGVLQEFVDYANATAVRPQPQLAVQAALAFGSVVLGRMWSTDGDNYPTLYFMNVAPTAAGKEHARKVITQALEASRLEKLIGPKGYTSEAAVLSRLSIQPRHISIWDEAGRYISSARKSGNGNKQDAQTMLMEIYGNLEGTVRGISYSTRGMTKEQIEEMMNTTVTRPALTLLGMTTPATLYEAVGTMDVKDGFLNRFIIVQSVLGRQMSREDVVRMDVPAEIISWAREHAFQHGGTEEDDDRTLIDPKFVPPPVIVPFSKAARRLAREIETEIIEDMNKWEAAGMADLFGRTRELALRLSLIIARSERSDTVKESHLAWAWDYVRYYHRQMVDLFMKNMGKSEHERIAEDVFAFLKKQGSEGAVPSDIAKYVRSFRALDTRGRDEILIRVQSDMDAKHTVPEGKGHKTKRYFAPKK
jgi:hypothetical protein